MRLVRYLGIAAVGLSLAGCQSMLSPFGLHKSARLSPALEREIAEDYFHERAEQGRRLVAQGNYATAIEAFRQASADPKQRAKSLNGLAVCYAALDRNDLARRYFQEAILADPTDIRFAANLRRLETHLSPDMSNSRLADADAVSDVQERGPELAAIVDGPKVAHVEIVETRVSPNAPIARSTRKLANSAVSIEVPTIRPVRIGRNEVFISSRPGRTAALAQRGGALPIRIVLSQVPRR